MRKAHQSISTCAFLLLLVTVVSTLCGVSSFQCAVSTGAGLRRQRHRAIPPAPKATTSLMLAKEAGDYSRELLLREEAESPFRKVRFFFYASLGAGAMVSLLVSVTRVAAALSGINTDLLQESAINVGVDAVGLVVLAFLWRNDVQAQESRLKRASKGAELAKLKVRGSKSMMEGYISADDSSDSSDTTANETFTTSLASLRRGRGIEKRVIIAAGGKKKIAAVLDNVRKLEDALVLNDLLVVPVELPRISAPEVPLDDLPPCVALPVGQSWNVVVGDEVEQAVDQGLNVEEDGFCVILKKNGKVGQRTKGVFLENMVNEVTMRRDAGMDVKNI